MKKSVKTLLMLIVLALVVGIAGLIWFGLRPDKGNEMVGENLLDTSRGPAFEVLVVVPRGGLPLGGILPDWVLKKHDLTPRELGFDHTSSGAKVVSVGQDRIEFSADGWNLFIESDGQGRVVPQGTHLVFPLALGGRRLRLDCRPADQATGSLRTTTRAGSGELEGHFLIELAACKNAESGKATDWPPAPLTVRGIFAGLATRPSPAAPKGPG